MFNSPVLDTAIGLVFIFLLYSLLATSINEALSTLFSLRARMLRKGIIEGMLSNTSTDNAWLSSVSSFFSFLKEIWRLIIGGSYKYKNDIGGAFYNHPIIKNFGSQRRFSIPSYIKTSNFSAVLIEVLKAESEKLKEEISISRNISHEIFDRLPTTTKIDYLIKFLLAQPQPQKNTTSSDNSINIDQDTLKILQLHLSKSFLNLDDFTKRLDSWYDDSMNRVSGWYKRQVQFILFSIGILIGILFNVDVLSIASKLSTDKDAREKLVQMAIKSIDEYKDDPRIKRIEIQRDAADDSSDAKTYKSVIAEYKAQDSSVKKLLENDVKDANNLLALGWNSYGITDSNFISSIIGMDTLCIVRPFKWSIFRVTERFRDSLKYYNDSMRKESSKTAVDTGAKVIQTKGGNSQVYQLDSAAFTKKQFAQIYRDHRRAMQCWYIWQSFTPKKILSFLILAFAVCIGAPFWFDLLQKLVNLRSSGKKETTNTAVQADQKSSSSSPTSITVNNQTSAEEAIG